MLDIFITNAKIVDGTGKPSYIGDIGIKDGVFCDCGQAEARHTIDASGLLLTPGFIDMHCHPEGLLFASPKASLRVRQGITSEIGGNCGISPAPCNGNIELLKKYCAATFSGFDMPWNWVSFKDFMSTVSEAKQAINFGSCVGHGAIRIAAMGMDNRRPTAEEMETMKALLEEALCEGAIGLSLGLIYPPGVFAEFDELATLAEVVKKHNKIISVHMRNESSRVVESVREMIELAKKTGVRMHIAHHKIAGMDNKGLSSVTLGLIEEACRDGCDMMFDMYPYNSGCTQLSAILPPSAHAGGVGEMLERLGDPEQYRQIKEKILANDDSYDNLAMATTWDGIIISFAADSALVGKSIEAIANERKVEPIDCALTLILEQQNNIMMILYTMNDFDVEQILRHPLSIIASDGVPSLNEATHPRFVGTFFRVLAHYHKQKRLLTLEDAVHKMTGKAAQRCGLLDRGTITIGKKADFVLLDYENIEDVTTYDEPNKTSDCVKYVGVNGVLAVDNGQYTGVCNGAII